MGNLGKEFYNLIIPNNIEKYAGIIGLQVSSWVEPVLSGKVSHNRGIDLQGTVNSNILKEFLGWEVLEL